MTRSFDSNDLLKDLPAHGGDVLLASEKYGIPVDQWIDLSTGINPDPYPIHSIPAEAFHNLPYFRPGFIKAVNQYYQQDGFLPIPGSQSVIQILPKSLNELLKDCEEPLDVMVPEVGYREHHDQWKRYSNPIHYYRSDSLKNMIDDIGSGIEANPKQHVVIIRPNNPTTTMVDIPQLLDWSGKLNKNCFLIVDEAFIDTTLEESLLTLSELPENIIVLRSFGKFFGLAGIRLGFVFAKRDLLRSMSGEIGLWQVNGPAQYIAEKALNDAHWQQQARSDIKRSALKTRELFTPIEVRFQLKQPLQHDLFRSYPMSLVCALTINHCLASEGILTRVIVLDDSKALLRVGNIHHAQPSTLLRVSEAVQALCDEHKFTDLLSSFIRG